MAWYWSVRWDLRGRPAHRQVTLPHASSHLTVEDGAAWLYGPPRHRFERTLTGAARVIGVRFTAGGLAALLGRAVVGGPVPASTLPGLDGDDLAAAVTGSADIDKAAHILDRALTAVLPRRWIQRSRSWRTRYASLSRTHQSCGLPTWLTGSD